MRKALIIILAAGCCIAGYATDARVASMGKHDAFFMDEESVFRNPANVSIYPNMIYGSLGKLTTEDSTPKLQDPFFGAIISYSTNGQSENGGQYPMLSLGAVFNRYDEMLDYVTKGKPNCLDSNISLYKPVGKVDLLLGYVMQNGFMLGVGGYIAAQEKEKDGVISQTKVYKGNIGVNWPVAKTMDLEMSLSGGLITAIADGYELADRDKFGRFEVRLFSALAGINGDFVPRARVDFLNLEKDNDLKINIAAGLGMNLNIDKGFFWSGLEFVYEQRDKDAAEASQDVGGRISFGIERNVIWDWLVIRTGGQKTLLVKKVGADEKEFHENASFDESLGDLIGFGFGINIENRLRIDFVANELLPYTFTDMISNGQLKYIFNKMSVTYSF